MADHPDYDPVIAKAWADRRFKARLLKDPRTAVAVLGIAPPAGATLRVVEDTAETCCLVLPPPPPGVRLTVTEDTDTVCTLVLPPPPVDVEDPVEQAGDIANRVARWTALIAAPFAS